MLETILLFLGSVSEIHFRERTLVWGVLLQHCFFLPMYLLHTYAGFCSRKCLVKIIFLLGSVFEIHFGERTSVFAVLLCSSVFRWCLPLFLHTCAGFCSRNAW